MGICTLGKSNWEIFVNIPSKNRAKFLFFFPVNHETFLIWKMYIYSFSHGILSATKVVKILQKLGSLFKNVPHMTVTVEEEWEPTFGFWTNQYILFCA